jgi:hypothetical protein
MSDEQCRKTTMENPLSTSTGGLYRCIREAGHDGVHYATLVEPGDTPIVIWGTPGIEPTPEPPEWARGAWMHAGENDVPRPATPREKEIAGMVGRWVDEPEWVEDQTLPYWHQVVHAKALLKYRRAGCPHCLKQVGPFNDEQRSAAESMIRRNAEVFPELEPFRDKDVATLVEIAEDEPAPPDSPAPRPMTTADFPAYITAHWKDNVVSNPAEPERAPSGEPLADYHEQPAPPVLQPNLPAPERDQGFPNPIRDPDAGLPPWHRDKHEYLRRQVERPAWKDEVLTCPNCDAEFFSAQDAVVTSLGEDQPRNAARVPIHAFKGRSDRPCEMCGKPDRNPVHDERYG